MRTVYFMYQKAGVIYILPYTASYVANANQLRWTCSAVAAASFRCCGALSNLSSSFLAASKTEGLPSGMLRVYVGSRQLSEQKWANTRSSDSIWLFAQTYGQQGAANDLEDMLQGRLKSRSWLTLQTQKSIRINIENQFKLHANT